MRKFHVHEENASLGNVNGMGKIGLPSVDGGIGSGDIPSSGVKKKKKTLKKFKEIHDELISEQEIYFHISKISDTAGLVEKILDDLTSIMKSADKDALRRELMDINISYNAKVEGASLRSIYKNYQVSPNILKKRIDRVLEDNIHFIEETLEHSLKQYLNGEIQLNESILGRAVGAIGGFALGPKIGKIIAKVLGISERGPLYNVLTSRVVSAALAQELTKNLF